MKNKKILKNLILLLIGLFLIATYIYSKKETVNDKRVKSSSEASEIVKTNDLPSTSENQEPLAPTLNKSESALPAPKQN